MTATQYERWLSQRKQSWCKNRKGLEHRPVLTIDTREASATRSCGRVAETWKCFHKVICGCCNRILDHAPPCPDRPY